MKWTDCSFSPSALNCCLDKHLYFLATVCKGAKADLVFLIDGSWSIGDESFNKVIQFVTSMIGAFEVISPNGMQVCVGFTLRDFLKYDFVYLCLFNIIFLSPSTGFTGAVQR